MAATALEYYMMHDYKNCLSELSKIKSNKASQEKGFFRILNNTAVAEYISEKNRKVTDFLNKMEDLIQELKPKNNPSHSKQSKNARKTSGLSDDDANDKNNNDVEDDMILKYNYAVALYHAGKKSKSLELINALLTSQDVVFDYVVIKLSCLCLDLALMSRDYNKAQKILEFFERNAGSASSDLQNEFEKSDISMGGEKDGILKRLLDANSLLLPAEVYKQRDRPRINSKLEFSLITLIYKIQVLIHNGSYDIAARKMKELDHSYEEFLNSLKTSNPSNTKSGGNDKQKASQDGKSNDYTADRLLGYVQTIYKYIKAWLAYHSNDTRKCIQILATPIAFDKFDNPRTADGPYDLFLQYNNLGCVHFKERKYNLAASYLTKAVNVFQKQLKPGEGMSNSNNLEESSKNKFESAIYLAYSSKLHLVLYNLGTALFRTKKYAETIDIFTTISDKMIDHPHFWYIFGLAYLSKYHQLLQENHQQRKTNLYETVIDPHKSGLEEDNSESKESHHYTRYVLNAKDVNITPTEEEIGAGSIVSNKHEQKYEQYYKINDASGNQIGPTALKAYLEKARNCLRSCLIIIQRLRTQGKDDKSSHVKSSDYEKDEKSRHDDHGASHGPQAKYQEILQSVYVHLAYLSLGLGEINSAINYAKEAIALPNQSEENKYLCLMYLVESYCHLGNAKEALHKINQMNIGQNILTAARNVLGINQAYFNDSMSNKTVIFTNLTTIHLLKSNYNGAQESLKNAFPADSHNIPPLPLLNLKIYFHLRNGEPYQALQLLKRRKILSTSGSNKMLLKISK